MTFESVGLAGQTFAAPENRAPVAAPTTMDVWRPKDAMPVVALRWMVTNWCSYRCPYCPRTHDRRAQKGDRMTAHAFDNFPLQQWLEAFDRHFAGYRLSVVITGGEPMVDRKNVPKLLNFLSAKTTVECIRIDTNLSWSPMHFQLSTGPRSSSCAHFTQVTWRRLRSWRASGISWMRASRLVS